MVQITDQEKLVLKLVAEWESGSLGYEAYYPGSRDSTIPSKTLTEISAFQEDMLADQRRRGVANPSSAIGKYQFIRDTFRAAYTGLNMDPNRIRFTSEIQDALILYILRTRRGMELWKDGNSVRERLIAYQVDPITDDPDIGFHVLLALEFASIPAPYSFVYGSNRKSVTAGKTVYPSNNTARHEVARFTAQLKDIRNGGTGVVTDVDISAASANGALPSQGSSSRRVAENASSGGQRMTGGHATSRGVGSAATLPVASDVYIYQKIDFYDNRYDFRTGKKVRDMGINGTASATDVGTTSPITDEPGIAPPPESTSNQIDPGLRSAADANLAKQGYTLAERNVLLSGTAITASSPGSLGDGLRGPSTTVKQIPAGTPTVGPQ